MARRGFVMRHGRSVRETRWLDISPVTTNLAAATTAAISHSLSAVELALRPFTIIRTRLNWLVRSDQTAATEFYGAAIGICVVSEQANAIGVTAVPTPVTDQESDLWLLYDALFGDFSFGDATGFQNEAQNQRALDSKAARKVQDGEDVIVVHEGTGLGGGSQSIVTGRMLIKLH